MALLTVPFTYSAGAVIIASQLNSCNTTIYSDYNGNIDNTNIAPSAAIAYSKLSLTGSILNADVNASAAIVDTKLAQITTASKVSGTAIIGLASLPSGAGVVPTANLGSGTANSGTVLYGDQTYKTAPNSISNVLFQYSGQVEFTGSKVGEIVGTTLVPSAGTGNYRFLQTNDSGGGGNFKTIWTTKFIKISGISTVTVWARIWQQLNGTATIKVDIGGVNGNVSGTSSQVTPEWKTFTIDVSGLSNGTSYDVTASMTNNVNAIATFCSNIISFGS